MNRILFDVYQVPSSIISFNQISHEDVAGTVFGKLRDFRKVFKEFASLKDDEVICLVFGK